MIKNYVIPCCIFFQCLFGVSFQLSAQALGDTAHFGIRGHIYSDTPTINTHDWFKGDSSLGVIDTTQTTLFKTYVDGTTNKAFDIGQSVPVYSDVDGKYLYDSRFGHDYLSFSGSKVDTTAFQGGNKNGQNPNTDWGSIATTVPTANDLVDIYVHMRRDGVDIDSALWLMLGLSSAEGSGSHFADFELFANDIEVDSLGNFVSAGTEEGHTAWVFDSAGNVLNTGDLVVGLQYSGSGPSNIEVRIWVSRSDFSGLTPANFSWGASIAGGTPSSTYGYAQVITSGAVLGEVNSSIVKSPPWGTYHKNTSGVTTDTTYPSNLFVEIAVSLTGLGIDPILSPGKNKCGSPFSKIMAKSRSSASFTSSLKDYAGPYDFIGPPLISTELTTVSDTVISCSEPVVSLIPQDIDRNALYKWITDDGLFNNDQDTFVGDTALIKMPGTYYLITAPLQGCSQDTSDAIFVYERLCIDAINDINTTWINTAISGNVITNDIKNEYDTLLVNTTPIFNVSNGTLTLNADGSYIYTPNLDFHGIDSFAYEVCDTATYVSCEIAVVYISVDLFPSFALNNDIIANNDHFVSLRDSSLSNTVTSNDYDLDKGTLTVNSSPLQDVNYGTLILNTDGTFTYTPNSGFIGLDTFKYIVCDAGIPTSCDTATTILEIIPGDPFATGHPPFAVDDFVIIDNKSSAQGILVLNDYDLDSDSISINTTAIIGPSNGSIQINLDGTYIYTPNPGYVGTVQVVYEVCDTGAPIECAQATLYVNIHEAREPLVTMLDKNVILQDSIATGTVLTNDYGEGDLFITVINDSSILTGGITITTAQGGSLNIDSTGNYSYTPDSGFSGIDTIVYKVCELQFPLNCTNEYLIIEVLALPDPSDGTNSIVGVPDKLISWGDTVGISLVSNDYDPEWDIILFSGVRNPLLPASLVNSGLISTIPGVDTAGNTIADAGDLIVSSNGSVSFVPALGFVGYIELTYQICDNKTPSACTDELLSIEVKDTLTQSNGYRERAPVANDDFSATDMNTTVVGQFWANDYDPNTLDRLTVNGVTIDTLIAATSAQTLVTKEGGAIELFSNGTYSYTPPSGFSGTDEAIYEICDTLIPIDCVNATVHFLVSPVVRDYMEFPDSLYGLVYARFIDSASNTMSGSVPYWLGSNISDESAANLSIDASGDSYDDGLIYPTVLDSTQANTFSAIVNSSFSGLVVHYKVWIDWNTDGMFDSTYQGKGVTASPDTIQFDVFTPSGLSPGPINLRIVAQTDSTKLDDRVLASGEVEDYQIMITAVLPVTLLSYHAQKHGEDVLLLWSTAQEYNNDKFIIEYSLDGLEFVYLNELRSKGDGNSIQTYQLIHRNAQLLGSKMIYYRLKQVDQNGTVNNLGIRKIIYAQDDQFTLVPNPALPEQAISIIGKDIFSVKIFDAQGRIVKALKYNLMDELEQVDVKLNGLRSGMYFVVVNNFESIKLLVE